MTASTAEPVVESSAASSSPKAVKAAAAAHPSTAVMVMSAITELKEKKGSSLPAVKKYISDNYRVDSTRLAPFIRKFLKAAVLKGSLVQTNGVGATGRFKLPAEMKKKKEPKVVATVKKQPKVVAKKTTAVETPKKRKLAAKKKSPTSKKMKTTTVSVTKPRKSLVKVKKAVSAIKQPKTKIATKPKKSLVKVKKTTVSAIKPPLTKAKKVTQIC